MGSNTIIARPFKRLGRRKTVILNSLTKFVFTYLLLTSLMIYLPASQRFLLGFQSFSWQKICLAKIKQQTCTFKLSWQLAFEAFILYIGFFFDFHFWRFPGKVLHLAQMNHKKQTNKLSSVDGVKSGKKKLICYSYTYDFQKWTPL